MSKMPEQVFGDWFRKNYPGPDTIIHKPDWHSPKIFNAAHHALKSEIAAQVAAAYARGVRDATRHATCSTGDVDLMNSILALIDYPTPDPDEPTEAAQGAGGVSERTIR